MGSPEERRLVEACIGGDGVAWRALVSVYGPAVSAQVAAIFRRASGRRPGPAELDETVQETFVRLFRNGARALRNFRGDASLATYLRAVATHAALSRIRDDARESNRLRRPLDAEPVEDEPPAADPGPPEIALESEAGAAVRAWVAGLPPRDRFVVRLYYWHGATPTEIAATLGMSPAYVCVILRRAVEKIRKEAGRRDNPGTPGATNP